MKAFRLLRLACAGCCFIASASVVNAAPVPTRVIPQQGSGPGYQTLQLLQAQAEAALKAGNAASAASLARQLLRFNTDKTSWNYGNVVYDGNQILGLAALKQGYIAAAEQALLAAGRTPGSPQLDSFGPEMTLAQALQKKGRTRVVLAFLDEVGRFWATPRTATDKRFLDLYKMHGEMLAQWKAEIRAGKQASLDRFAFSGQERPAPPLLATGTPAPDFAVQDRDGKPVHLSDYKGKVVVLDFWSTWCGPCQQSLPHTNQVARKYADKNVVVLAVNVWDKPEAFQAWLPQHKEYDALTFAIDPTGNGKDIATSLYHVSGIPTQYVLSREGKIVQSFVGYDGPTDDLENAIKAAQSVAQAVPTSVSGTGKAVSGL